MVLISIFDRKTLMFDTPILFLVFNRPEHTRKVFERIREIKPKYLFVAADGPRISHLEDAEKCTSVRSLITQGMDWDCEMKTLFREENLGCGKGPAEAITWFFDQVEEGIILEDDCLPDPSFFAFCSELLTFYRNEERVMHISGNNFQDGKSRGNAPYYFSMFSHNWGWATWRRAWKMFDFNLLKREQVVFDFYRIPKIEQNYWNRNFENCMNGNPDIWDFQWAYSIWSNSGLSILPNVNLVKNIGFDEDGTHTKKHHDFLSISTGSLNFIKHAKDIKIDPSADRHTFNKYYSVKQSFVNRIKLTLKSFIEKR